MHPIKTVIDNPIFTKILTINEIYRLFSNKLLKSSLNADMVVNNYKILQQQIKNILNQDIIILKVQQTLQE